MIHKGKPWRHQSPKGSKVLNQKALLDLVGSWWILLDLVGSQWIPVLLQTVLSLRPNSTCCCWLMLGWYFRLAACVVHAGAWLCILSSPPRVGHQVVMVYILSGGVPNKLLASWVMLLAGHCLYIPSPVGYLWSTRANHGGIRVQKDQKALLNLVGSWWILMDLVGSCW